MREYVGLLLGLLLFIQIVACDYNAHWVIEQQIVDFNQPANQALRGDKVLKKNQRIAYLINNQYPGPTIRVKQFDKININITNNLPAEVDDLTITWQGIRMYGAQYSDGALNVTQCPIKAGQTYNYSFTATEHGTYFYHAFLPQLYSWGLVGPIEITSPTEVSNDLFVDQMTWIMQDWLRDPSDFKTISQMAMNTMGQQQENQKYTNYSQMLPVNTTGYDRYEMDLGLLNGWWGDGSKATPYPTINVTSGKCYRMRFINANSVVPGMRWYIAGHSLKIIAHTSVNVSPDNFGMFTLYMSERMDGVLCASNKTGDYKIQFMSSQAITKINKQTGTPTCANPKDTNCFTAILRVTDNFSNSTYPGALASNKIIDQPNPWKEKVIDFVEHIAALQMLPGGDNPTQFPQYQDNNLTLNIGMSMDGSGYYFSPDRSRLAFTAPNTPLLYTKGSCGLTKNTLTYNISVGKIVDVVINNLVDTPHPLHMHGHRFWVAGAGYKLGANNSYCKGMSNWILSDESSKIDSSNTVDFSGCAFDPMLDKKNLNFTEPPYPDTVLVAPKSWVYTRIRFDNPGAWVFQCSRQMGNNIGNMIVFMVGENENWPKPPMGTQGCGCVTTEQLTAEAQKVEGPMGTAGSVPLDTGAPSFAIRAIHLKATQVVLLISFTLYFLFI